MVINTFEGICPIPSNVNLYQEWIKLKYNIVNYGIRICFSLSVLRLFLCSGSLMC